jgi:stage II sporulation protein GA (sporulation sigma-E factor processing peptidase)
VDTVVYVDVLLLLNYVVTVLLLEASARLLGCSPRRIRLVFASLLGAFSSLVIFLPQGGFFSTILTKAAISAAIVLVSFAGRGIAFTLKAWGMFFAVSFFFAGVMLGIWMIFSPGGMLYHNGVVYYHLNPMTLLACTVAAYILLSLFRRFSRGSRVPGMCCDATLFLGEKKVTLKALIDSGNSLYEPFSGTPVIVANLESVRPILPGPLFRALEKGDWEEAAKKAGTRVRLIPYKAVGGEGALPSIRLDCLETERDGAKRRVERVYLAVSGRDIGTEGCEVILSPDLAGRPVRVE